MSLLDEYVAVEYYQPSTVDNDNYPPVVYSVYPKEITTTVYLMNEYNE